MDLLLNRLDNVSATSSITITGIAPNTVTQVAIEKQVYDKLRTELNVDYSNFINHVWFGSAVDLFGYSLDTMDSYDLTGSDLDHQTWYNNLNNYNKFQFTTLKGLLTGSETWPTSSLTTGSQTVINYINAQVVSASNYDVTNMAYIRNFYDDVIWEDENVDIKNTVLSLAGLFDRMKLYIDHFINTKKISYENYNNVPKKLMSDLFKKYGFEQYGFWSDEELVNYLVSSNINIYDIKTEIWKRILNNLIYILKSKGTSEAGRALLRTHGVDNNTIKVREFTNKQDNIKLGRYEQKEVSYMALLTGSKYFYTIDSYNSPDTMEFNCAFVPCVSYEDSNGQTTILTNIQYITCSLISKTDLVGNFIAASVVRTPLSNKGFFVLTGSENGLFTSSTYSIFDKEPIHLALQFKNVNGNSVELDIRKGSYFSASLTGTFSAFGGGDLTAYWGIGGSPDTVINTEIYVNEVKHWNRNLTDDELKEHTLNYKNFSADDITQLKDDTYFAGYWRIQDNLSNVNIAANGGLVSADGTGDRLQYSYPAGTPDNENIFDSFLYGDYSYLSMPFDCRTDNKIRINSGSNEQIYNYDINLISVELNMIDRVNEYMSRLINENFLENFNNVTPLDRYKMSYESDKQLYILLDLYQRKFPNFKSYQDACRYFDFNFLKSIQQLVPASVKMIEGLVIENPACIQEKYVHIHYNDSKGNVPEKTLEYSGNIITEKGDSRVSSIPGLYSNPAVIASHLYYKKQVQLGNINNVIVSTNTKEINRMFRVEDNNNIGIDNLDKLVLKNDEMYINKGFNYRRQK